MNSIHPVILCGGAGTRLWPSSRKAFPKQFSQLVGPESLYQQTLRRLSGQTHELHSAVCLARGETVIWQHQDSAELQVRPLSEEFIAGYLDRAGPSVLWSVGCYQIEGLGVQLFERVEGDYFTILSLPLLPLLNFLRGQGLLPR